MSEKTIVATGGERESLNCPVTVCLPAGDVSGDAAHLVEAETERVVPAQLGPQGGDARALSFVIERIQPGEQKRYAVKNEAAPDATEVALTKQDEEKVDIEIAGGFFSAYYFGENWVRPFLYPLMGPYGQPITRSYPVIPDVPGETQDHPHHKSCWVAWGDVNGADNWSEKEGAHGWTRHQRFNVLESGPVYGHINVLNFWTHHEGEKVLEETRDLKIYNLPRSGRAIDLTVTLDATEGDARFGDTKEGGIASLRVATTMDVKGGEGRIENAVGGVSETETWGKRAHWCDYSGPVGGNIVGAAIFDNPSNFRFPTYWHVRNYGLMTANPFGLSHFYGDESVDGSHTLPAGETMTFRYRYFVHPGDARIGRVAEAYLDYLFPPATEVE